MMVNKKLDSDGYKMPFILYRLISHLVNQNFGDVEFAVQNTRIKGVRSLICSQNEIFNRLVNDSLAESVIQISCDITPSSFNSLLTYYGYGTVKIDDDNVVEMIVICVSYSETSLLNVCVKYLHEHFKFKLAFKLFSNLKILNSRNLLETKKLVQSYIPIIGSYLLASDIMYQLEPQIIEDILRTNNLIVENEEFLLERILSYYEESYSSGNNNSNNNSNNGNANDMQNCLQKLLLQIKWNEIPKEKLNQNLLPYYNNIPLNLTPRIYFKLPVTYNELLNEIIMKCCYGLFVKDIHLNDEIGRKIKCVNINNHLRELFGCNNIKLEIIVILLIHEYSLYVDLNFYYNQVMNDIMNFYKFNISNEREKVFCESAVKCLSFFVEDNDSITKITSCCSDNIIYLILNINYNLSPRAKNKLVEYLCSIKISNNKMNEIRQNISDIKIVQYVESYNLYSTSSLRDSLLNQDNYSFNYDDFGKRKRDYRYDGNNNSNSCTEEFSESKRFKLFNDL